MHRIAKGRAQDSEPEILLPWLGVCTVLVFYVSLNLYLVDDVIRLVRGAANPFFSMLIICVTLAGQMITVWQAWRLTSEARFLSRLRSAGIHEARARDEKAEALDQALSSSVRVQGLSIWKLFNQLRLGRSAAQGYDRQLLNAHLKVFEEDISRRITVPQYIANTLIGLGLFGTFLGLIVTLKQVALLIGIFSTTGDVNANDMMGQFFQKMSGPLAGMGEAFVASLLGLGGSIVNNAQLLPFKKLQKHLTYRAEPVYVEALETLDEQPSFGEKLSREGNVTLPLVEVLAKEMTALRLDLRRQTDAVLLAASHMRQGSEVMGQTLSRLEKQQSGEDALPQFVHVAAVVEQRLDALVRKSDDNQQIQGELLNASRDLQEHLHTLTDKLVGMTQSQASVTRELVGINASFVQDTADSRDALRQQLEDLKTTVRADLGQLTSTMADAVRAQREQAATASDISISTREAVHRLQQFSTGGQQLAKKLQHQLGELIARLEKNDQALASVMQNDWSELLHKIDRIDISQRTAD